MEERPDAPTWFKRAHCSGVNITSMSTEALLRNLEVLCGHNGLHTDSSCSVQEANSASSSQNCSSSTTTSANRQLD